MKPTLILAAGTPVVGSQPSDEHTETDETEDESDVEYVGEMGDVRGEDGCDSLEAGMLVSIVILSLPCSSISACTLTASMRLWQSSIALIC
jgi:hypothetical protein